MEDRASDLVGLVGARVTEREHADPQGVEVTRPGALLSPASGWRTIP
jgi:hypothetical protein